MRSQTVVETAYGTLQGYSTGRCLLFAGIPYAAAPIGIRKFQPPEPPKAWAGKRDATHFGPIQPQSPSRFEVFWGPDPQPQSEDSLRLNVWTPATDNGRRPVLVFFHGGAWVSGSGSFPMYHGDAFAERHGIVVVTLNYRLAEAGGLYLGHRAADFATSGNTALLDQIAALIWVREHIAAFGGDPNNVTLCGQSAGANAILALMAAPRAAGLFHRALCQSPSYMVRSKDDAINTTERFLQILEIKTITALQNMSLDALLAARGQLMRENAKPPSLSVWGAVLDDEVIPQHPWHAATAGTLAPIPLLIGVCYHDYRPYLRLLPTETLPQDEAAIMRLFDSLGVHGRCMLQVYRDRFGSSTPAELLIEAMTDYRFRQPSIHLAQQHALHHPTFMYEFMWASPVQHGTLGSGHTVDIPFAWHTLWTPSTPYHLGDDPPTALADLMHEAWSTFARSGHPSAARLPMWPPYEPQQRATMALDTQPVLLVDPEQTRRCYWAEQSLLSCFSTSNRGFR